MSSNGRPASANEVQELRRAIMNGVPRDGEMARHWQDVKHLKPEVAGIDVLSFPIVVSTAGVITQPDTQSLPAGYLAELFAIRGYMQSPATDPELAPLIDFNVRDRERSGNLFSTNIEMAYLVAVTSGGVSDGLCWNRGLYVFDPGSRVQVTVAVDGTASTGYAGQAGAAKEWGVLLQFNLYSI